MNKNVLIGIAAFGGLLLIGVMLPDTPKEDGQQAVPEEVSEATLPDSVQSSFPIHPYVAIRNMRESTGDDNRIFYSFSLEAEATIADINAWYRNELSQNGWTIKSDKNVAGYQIIQAEKDNLFTSMQAANGNAPGTAIISQQAQIRP